MVDELHSLNNRSELEVTQTVQVGATPERVWRALTDPAELRQWYAPGCQWEIPTLAPGAGVRFFNSDTDIQGATITALIPGRRFALLWRPDAILPTSAILTTYDMSATADGTVVTLRHSGYESVPVDQRAAWLEADRGAVPTILSALARHVTASP